MEVFISEKYKDQSQYGRYLIDSKNKDKRYFMGIPQSIYCMYLNDGTTFPHTLNTVIDEIRAYGRGEQDTNKYKEVLYSSAFKDAPVSNDKGTDTLRKGLDQLLDDIVSYYPKIRTMIHGMVSEAEFDVFVDCVDWKSVDKKRQKKWELWNKKVNAEFIKEFSNKAGIPIDEPTYLPQSLEELNDFEASGNFRLNEAKVIEKIIDNHWDHSKWDYLLKKKIVDDFIDLNFAVVKNYYDTAECRFREKYIDPKFFVAQDSASFEFEDSSYWGHFEIKKIVDLIAKGIDQEELIKVARNYNGVYGNKFYPDERWESLSAKGNSENFYLDFIICTFECEWVDIDYSVTSSYTKGRRTTVKNMPYDYTPKPISASKSSKGYNQEVKDLYVQKLYKSTWIVNSDICYDHGPANFVDRPVKSRVKSSYTAVKITGRSLTSMLKPLLDMFQITWNKLLDSLAKAFDSGYAVNVHMLENISNGRQKLDPGALLNLLKKEKFLLYKYSVPGNYKGGASSPITPIPSTLGTEINQHLAIMNTLLKMIEDTTGLNPVSLGGTPRTDQAVGTTNASLSASSNLLKPLILSVFKVKSNSSESVARRIPLAMTYNKEIFDSYKNVIGESEALLLKEGAVNDIVYSFSFKERSNNALVQRMLGYIQAALDLGRNGTRGGIELDTAMRIESMLLRGANLEDIRIMLSYEIKKYNEKLEMAASRNTKANQEGAERAEQLKTQGRLGEIQAQFQADAQLQQLTNQGTNDSLILKNNQDIFNYMVKQSEDSDE